MNNKILRKAETYRKTHTKNRWLYRGLSVLAAGAVFCTTYALILPAITMESGTLEHWHNESCYAYTAETKVFACTALPHEHTDECRDAEGKPICGYADYFVHAHDASCYDEEGILLCELPEIGMHEHGAECFDPEVILLHGHTDKCIGMEKGELICEITESEGHIHNDNCIGVVSETLICELSETEPHGHGAECYKVILTDELICTEEEAEAHSHSESCNETVISNICGLEKSEEHPHEDSCFEESSERICVLDETAGHAHSAECYGKKESLVCETEETEGHTHGGGCYKIVTDNTCGQEEAEAHPHEDSCYAWTEILLCEAEAPEEERSAEEEAEPICGFDEVILHTHVDECFDEDGAWVCGMVEVLEHRHTEECYTVEVTEYEEPVLICELEEYYRTAEDCAAEFAELVNTLPDPEDEEYYDAYYTAFDAYAMAFDLYCEEHPEMEGQEEFDTWLDELGYYDEYEDFAAMPDPNDVVMYAPTTSAEQTDDITRYDIEGIDFKLFNYDVYINAPNRIPRNTFTKYSDQDTYYYFSFRGETDTGVIDGKAGGIYDADPFTVNHTMVEPTLLNGFPVLDFSRDAGGEEKTETNKLPQNLQSRESRSLEYLFTKGDNAVTAYDPSNTILNTDGNGHYWYDSANNAVDYDETLKLLRVRSYPERISTTTTYIEKNGLLGDFLPFNYTGGTVIGQSNGYDYHINATSTDYWFGMTMEFEFFQTENGLFNGEEMIFNFSGDDDVYVFVDDVLVLNLGGTHGTVKGSINFATGEILQYLAWNGANSTVEEKTNGSDNSFPTTLKNCFTAAEQDPTGGWDDTGNKFADYSKHTLKFFYLERGSGVANCSIDFVLPVLPEKSLTYGKQISVSENASSELNAHLQESLEYNFRVLKADDSGNITDNLLVTEGTYNVLDKDNKVTGKVTVGETGIVTLKHGQWIQIPDMWNKYEDKAEQYFVQELIPSELKDQYEGVEWETDLDAVEVAVTGSDGTTDEYFGYNAGPYSISETAYMTFTNKINVSNLSKLLITKSKAAGSGFNDATVFDMKVTLGGTLIPVGTPYTLDGESKTVEKEGIIPLTAGQTAMIEGIISGTKYEVEENISGEDGYTVSYTGTVTVNNQTTDLPDPANDGSFPLASIIHVIVTNADYDLSASVPLTKTTYGLQEKDEPEFEFTVTPVEWNPETDEWVQIQNSSLPSTYLTVASEESRTEVVIGYRSTDVSEGQTFYYLIEEADLEGYICDDTWYIVEVKIDMNSGTIVADTVIIERDGESDTYDTLAFTNYRSAILTVAKTVTGNSATGTFPFEAAIADCNGFILEEGDGYTLDGTENNAFSFELSQNGKIQIELPIGASVTVTETENAGYITSYTIDDSKDPIYSTTADVTIDADGVTVHYTNKAGTELPSTGGIGTFPYTLGGLMIVGASGILFMYSSRRKQRD